MPDKKDSVLLNNFGKANPKLEVMRNNIRK
jgi:hypothetical protein